MRDTARLVAVRASVAIAQERWDAARADIRRLIVLSSIVGSEGGLEQRASAIRVRDIGLRSAFQALRFWPQDRLGDFLEDMCSLAPQMQHLATPTMLEEIEPCLGWPDRFVLPDLEFPTMTITIADQCAVAHYRLLLLAAAAKTCRAENGQLPKTMDDLRMSLGGSPPLDPFSGEDFLSSFSTKSVRFSVGKDTMPESFRGMELVYLGGEPITSTTVDADGTIMVE
jgi:hypothetical protein